MLGTFVNSSCDIKRNVQNCYRNLAVRGLCGKTIFFSGNLVNRKNLRFLKTPLVEELKKMLILLKPAIYEAGKRLSKPVKNNCFVCQMKFAIK